MGLPDFNYPASKVSQIFFVDKDGQSIKLNKTEQGNWIVNDKYEANEELMGRILEDIENQKAIGKVEANKKSDIKKNLEAHYTKVKVYNKKELVKEYFVGRADPSNRGNYMTMPPLPDIYDVQLPSNPRNMQYDYSTTLNDWRSIWLIDVPADDIKQVHIEYPDSSSNSFLLTNNAPHYTVEGTPKIDEDVNTVRVVSYLNFFTKVSSIMVASEHTNREKVLAPEHQYASLKLTQKNGASKVYDVYFQPISQGSKNYFEGTSTKYDADHYLVHTPADDELYVVTIEVFGKLLRYYPEFFTSSKT